MSAIRQIRVTESDASPATDPGISPVAPAAPRDNPLQLLRDAIAQLKSPTGALPDQEQVANLLAEAREALEHANVVGRAVAQCDAHLGEEKFEQAFEALDEALRAYPDDRTLVAKRRGVEEDQRALQSAVAVRGAIEEAKWLLDHDRTDLAAQFLKQKTAELPDQDELAIRLAELEALLPQWEQNRGVQDALARAQSLEQLQQWQAALTVIEEALQAYPSNAQLREAAERIRAQSIDYERRKKLARRIELIRQQISARAWRQALTLLENTQLELSGDTELKPLRWEITVGLRRSECEDTVAEVRKCLADGELDQAELVLQRGLNALGTEPALETVRKELESEKKYRGQLRRAQVLFGRSQLEEAERVLIQLIDQDRPEAQALLEAVRSARASTEEENFLESGREKALGLIQQQEFAQAADLLRNLLSLFPGNPLLERDMAAAQAGLEQAGVLVVADLEAAEEEPAAASAAQAPPPSASTAIESAGAVAPGRFRRVAIAGAAGLVLASAAGTAWKRSQRAAPAPSTAALPTATPASPVTQPPAQPPAAELPTSAPAPSAPAPSLQTQARQPVAPSKPVNTTPLRAFVPPNTSPSPGKNTAGALPLPPGTDPVITVTTIPTLPAGINTTAQAPAPPPPAASPAPAQPPVVTPAPAPGGKIVQAILINRTLPVYPALARQRAIAGAVRLTAIIDEHGNVNNVKIVAGDVLLGAAAKNALLTWKYKPATLNGRPVATPTEIEIVFGDRNK